MAIKGAIKKLLSKFGYKITKDTNSIRGWSPGYLRSLSSAEIIIDIGAGNGTPDLYKAFHERKFVLFEPLIEYRHTLERWAETLDCSIHFQALGNTDGETVITIDPRRMTMSSLVERSKLTESDSKGAQRRVKISKLDSIIDGFSKPSNTLVIKIDVEGFELEVLKGAKETLKRTDLVIVESSIAELYVNNPNYFDVLCFMHEQGFRLLDILDLAYYKDWPGLMWADLAFVPDRRITSTSAFMGPI